MKPRFVRRAEPPPPRLQLALPPGGRPLLRLWAASAAPAEACGLLVGRRRGTEVQVCAIVPADNRLGAPDRYEIDPAQVLRADQVARDRGLEMVGAWHSHPDSAAVPSATDRELAWPDWCYLIVGGEDGWAELRAWRLVGEDFVEDEVEP
jgi:proteasome lid subunit RPN8/RPN11